MHQICSDIFELPKRKICLGRKFQVRTLFYKTATISIKITKLWGTVLSRLSEFCMADYVGLFVMICRFVETTH